MEGDLRVLGRVLILLQLILLPERLIFHGFLLLPSVHARQKLRSILSYSERPARNYQVSPRSALDVQTPMSLSHNDPELSPQTRQPTTHHHSHSVRGSHRMSMNRMP
mmetsp:Transcript_14658/g.50036  ORF Transcript_14658/g.50036 Transcript_14658/m.50036 type:complete len:107 (-) Transcript_14658:74-394(-)